ncbi:MAG: hypothetical protein JNM79_01630 [Burkholderiales bacterium]|nr:hypothetical protein [Burkholderiales bacterium]
MSKALTPLHQDLREALFAHVGTNLLLYQNLEWTLKALLPLIDSGDAKHSLENLLSRQKRLKRQTLGTLAGRLIAVSKGSDPEFGRLVKKVGKDRNDLAHHFLRSQKVVLGDSESCKRAIDSLVEQRQELQLLTCMLHNLLVGSLHVIIEGSFAGTPEYAQVRRLLDQLNAQLRGGADLDWIQEIAWEEGRQTKSTDSHRTGLKDRR